MEADPTHGETETEAETETETETGPSDRSRSITADYSAGDVTVTQERDTGRWVTVTREGEKAGRTTLSQVAILAEETPEGMRAIDLREALRELSLDD